MHSALRGAGVIGVCGGGCKGVGGDVMRCWRGWQANAAAVCALLNVHLQPAGAAAVRTLLGGRQDADTAAMHASPQVVPPICSCESAAVHRHARACVCVVCVGWGGVGFLSVHVCARACP